MDINNLFLIVAVLACPIIMGLMMWMMMRDTSHQGKEAMPTQPLSTNATDQLTALQQKRQALEVEITEVTRIVELETKRDQLMSVQSSASDRHHSDTAVQGNPVKVA